MVKAMRFFSTLMTFICLALTLNADEHYLLPEQKSDLIHTLKMKIERAKSVTIITNRLDSPALLKSIEKALSRNSEFRLITSSLESAAFYAKYKNTKVKVPVSTRVGENFALNLFLIDESDVCFSTVAFSHADLNLKIGEVICTTDSEDIRFAKELEKRFSHRFEDYNR